ncbi:MAG TPA: carboxypeptidase-like regulatory domain-containing protein [Flavisolibacter sp.]
MILRSLFLTIIFAAGTLVARANTTPPGNGTENSKSDIAGGVIHSETKKPLMNVSVTAVSNTGKEKKVAVTDNNGNYYFNNLKPGTYKLVFEKDGFKRVTREKVSIRTDDGYQLNIEMEENDEFQILPGGLFF